MLHISKVLNRWVPLISMLLAKAEHIIRRVFGNHFLLKFVQKSSIRKT